MVQRVADRLHSDYAGSALRLIFLRGDYLRNTYYFLGRSRLVILCRCRMLRYFSEGTKNFAASWDNRINFLILALLIFSISSDIIAPEFTHHDEGVVAGIFLFVRYTIQISRLCKLVMDSKQHLELANQQKINLNEVVEEEHADVVGV